jgi:DNA-binding NarL/FixJ family response regulator
VRSGDTQGVQREQTPQPVRIVVVDDHVFMRELICRTLSRQSSRYKVLAEAGTAAEAIAACAQHTPDLLVLDVNLPGQSGIEAVPELKRVSPTTRILLCTAFGIEDRIPEAMRCGADGFVEKTSTWNDFLDAVDRVSRGERCFRSSSAGPATPDRIERRAPARESKPSLSPREREVLVLIAEGSTSKEIAARLSISVQTVETHRFNLMNKLDVHNVAGLVLCAVRNGFIKLPD